MKIKRTGFTLVEILIALSGLAVLALAASSYLFSILSQRDQALAEAMAVDQAETVSAQLGDWLRSAKSVTVSSGGKRLSLVGINECWLVEVNDVSQSLNYAKSSGANCQVPSETAAALTSQKIQIKNAAFSLVTSDGSSRTVSFDWTVSVIRPLWQVEQNYSQVFTNVVDEAI